MLISLYLLYRDSPQASWQHLRISFNNLFVEHLSVLEFEVGVSSSTLVTCVIFISIFSATKFQDKSELGKSSKSKANCHNFIFCIHLMVHWINLFKKFKTEKRSPRVFLQNKMQCATSKILQLHIRISTLFNIRGKVKKEYCLY